jgi:bisphosphoglycerate-dependent phosphoglycerate mutase
MYVPTLPMNIRVGVLYALYCLYQTQIIEPKQKIALTMGKRVIITFHQNQIRFLIQ